MEPEKNRKIKRKKESKKGKERDSRKAEFKQMFRGRA